MCVCLYVNQALQFLSKAHRCEMQASGWEKDTGTFKEVIRRAIDMGTGEAPPSTHRSEEHTSELQSR